MLIVDDERDVRETLGELLADEGFAVEAAWNGETALAHLEAGFRPNVIVLDLMMPVIDGPDLPGAAASHVGLANIPVVGLSAAPSPDADFEMPEEAPAFRAPGRKPPQVVGR